LRNIGDIKAAEVKTLLVFCDACGNIMVLKEKKSRLGVYVCRRCHTIKKIKAKSIEKKESINYIAPPVPV
jgi:DNA-directed RNA polymerase subunit M/transcription elongation factor TFIIS